MVMNLNLVWALMCPWARYFPLTCSSRTRCYKWIPAKEGKVTSWLCWGLATISQKQKLSSLAQFLVKRRWAPLDALKSVLTHSTLFFLLNMVLRLNLMYEISLDLYSSLSWLCHCFLLVFLFVFLYEQWCSSHVKSGNFDLKNPQA